MKIERFAVAMGMVMGGVGMASIPAAADTVGGVAMASIPAAADTVGEAATIEELQQIIEFQQQQLEQQQQLLSDLQTRVEALDTEIQEMPPPADAPGVTKSGEETVKLTVSGHINRGVLIGDDGEDTEAYNVDNDSSSSRARFLGDARVTEDLTISGALEWQMESNSTADVNQFNKTTDEFDTFSTRRAEAIFDSKKLGRLWIGQGWTASDSTSEVDFSKTSVVSYSAVADMAGGQILRERNTGDFITTDGNDIDKSDGSNGLAINRIFTNMDGLGRDDRVRYDSPTFAGFSVAGSWMTNNRTDGRYDLALRYGREFSNFQLGGAIAYSKPRTSSVDEQVNGSFSVLHSPTGLNLSFAGGRQNPKASGRNAPKFVWVKGGYIADWFSWGDTAFSIDYYKGWDLFSDDTDPHSLAAAVVQHIRDYGAELYLGVRRYNADDPTVNGERRESKDNTSVLIGTRVKF